MKCKYYRCKKVVTDLAAHRQLENPMNDLKDDLCESYLNKTVNEALISSFLEKIKQDKLCTLNWRSKAKSSIRAYVVKGLDGREF